MAVRERDAPPSRGSSTSLNLQSAQSWKRLQAPKSRHPQRQQPPTHSSYKQDTLRLRIPIRALLWPTPNCPLLARPRSDQAQYRGPRSPLSGKDNAESQSDPPPQLARCLAPPTCSLTFAARETRGSRPTLSNPLHAATPTHRHRGPILSLCLPPLLLCSSAPTPQSTLACKPSPGSFGNTLRQVRFPDRTSSPPCRRS